MTVFRPSSGISHSGIKSKGTRTGIWYFKYDVGCVKYLTPELLCFDKVDAAGPGAHLSSKFLDDLVRLEAVDYLF